MIRKYLEGSVIDKGQFQTNYGTILLEATSNAPLDEVVKVFNRMGGVDTFNKGAAILLNNGVPKSEIIKGNNPFYIAQFIHKARKGKEMSALRHLGRLSNSLNYDKLNEEALYDEINIPNYGKAKIRYDVPTENLNKAFNFITKNTNIDSKLFLKDPRFFIDVYDKYQNNDNSWETYLTVNYPNAKVTNTSVSPYYLTKSLQTPLQSNFNPLQSNFNFKKWNQKDIPIKMWNNLARGKFNNGNDETIVKKAVNTLSLLGIHPQDAMTIVGFDVKLKPQVYSRRLKRAKAFTDAFFGLKTDDRLNIIQYLKNSSDPQASFRSLATDFKLALNYEKYAREAYTVTGSFPASALTTIDIAKGVSQAVNPYIKEVTVKGEPKFIYDTTPSSNIQEAAPGSPEAYNQRKLEEAIQNLTTANYMLNPTTLPADYITAMSMINNGTPEEQEKGKRLLGLTALFTALPFVLKGGHYIYNSKPVRNLRLNLYTTTLKLSPTYWKDINFITPKQAKNIYQWSFIEPKLVDRSGVVFSNPFKPVVKAVKSVTNGVTKAVDNLNKKYNPWDAAARLNAIKALYTFIKNDTGNTLAFPTDKIKLQEELFGDNINIIKDAASELRPDQNNLIVNDYYPWEIGYYKLNLNGRDYIFRNSKATPKDRAFTHKPVYIHKIIDASDIQPVSTVINKNTKGEVISLRDPSKRYTYSTNASTSIKEIKPISNSLPFIIDVDNILGPTKVSIRPKSNVPDAKATFDYNFVPISESDLNNMIPIIKDNIAFVKEQIPGFVEYGSAKAFTKARTPVVPHDIDGFILLKDFDAFVKNNPNIKVIKLPNNRYEVHLVPDAGDMGIVDVNVVSDANLGFLGARYAREYPKVYRKSALDLYTGQSHSENNAPSTPLIDDLGNPLSAEQLLKKSDNVENTIIDNMVAAIERGTKTKQIERTFVYIAYADKNTVRSAIDKMRNYLINGEESGEVFPKLKFGTVEENKALLRSIDYPESFIDVIAKDPERMLLALDHYYLAGGNTFSRNINSAIHDSNGGIIGYADNIDGFYKLLGDWNTYGDSNNTTAHSPGGSAHGAGVNMTEGRNHHSGRPLAGVIQYHIEGMYDGMPALEALLKVLRAKLHKNYLFTPDEINIIKLSAKNHNVSLFRNFTNGPELLSAMPIQGLNVKAFLADIAKKLDINAISGSSIYMGDSGTYIGGARTLNKTTPINPNGDKIGLGLYDTSTNFEAPNGLSLLIQKLRDITNKGERIDIEPLQIKPQDVKYTILEPQQLLHAVIDEVDAIKKAYKLQNMEDNIAARKKDIKEGVTLGVGAFTAATALKIMIDSFSSSKNKNTKQYKRKNENNSEILER